MKPDWQIRYVAAGAAAGRAGKLALRYFEQAQLKVEWKHDDSPVTVADREAEQLIRETLHHLFPEDGFLGEEYGDTPGASGFRWVIDPIDGTRNFVRGIPVWATLVGLEYKGEPILGVAEAPALRTTWRAARGEGAYRNDRRIHVSDEADLKKSLLFYSSLSWFLKAGKQEVFLELTRRTERQRGFGDFYGHVLVAEGAGEIMIEHGVHAWDVAALKPIVEEAGGRMTDWDGGWDVNRPDVIASNGKRHEEVLAILAGKK